MNHPAAGAVLDLPVVSVQTTDEGGRAYWKDVVPHWTEKKQIVVDPPYEIVSAPPVFLRRYSNPRNVLLRKVETQQAAANPGPAPAPAPAAGPPPPPPPPDDKQQPGAVAAPAGGIGKFQHAAAAMVIHGPISQAAEHVQLNAQLVKPLSAVIAEAAAAPVLPDRTEIYRSGPQISGEGKNVSEPYALCSGDAPKGYVIKSIRFLLVGDRQCNRWATCKETRNEPTKVCWEFSLQGHEEQLDSSSLGRRGRLTARVCCRWCGRGRRNKFGVVGVCRIPRLQLRETWGTQIYR